MVWKRVLEYLRKVLSLLVATPILFTVLAVMWILAIGGST